MRILVLEDNFERIQQFQRKLIGHVVEFTTTAELAIEMLKSQTWDVLFLDHDLGGPAYVDSFGDVETGYTVAKWIFNNMDRKPKHVFIHSLNGPGALNIQNRIPGSLITPFAWVEEVMPTFKKEREDEEI